MNDLKTHNKSEKISAAKLGVLVGSIFSLLGIISGFYFGIIRPALSSGQFHELPALSLWMGIILGVVFLLICGFCLWRWIRPPRRPPTEPGGDEW